MPPKQQKSNVVLVVAIVGVIGTVIATTITAFGNYNVEKMRQEAELTRIAIVSSAIPTVDSRTTNIFVDSRLGWQETGVFANEGDLIQIVYVSGLWTIDAKVFPLVDGHGFPSEKSSGEPMPDYNKGALIAKIGDGQFIRVENDAKFIADRNGVIYLRINDGDCCLVDNNGFLTVGVTVQKP